VAHIAYFHDELVSKRRWLSDHAFTELVALCQLLPGPASSQLGFAIGLHRGGYPGGAAAWLGFTLPSAALMIGAAYGLHYTGWAGHAGLLTGLKAVAVAVVARAVWHLGRKICTGLEKLILASASALLLLGFATVGTTLIVLVLGGLYGLWRFKDPSVEGKDHSFGRWEVSPRAGIIALTLFFGLLLSMPVLAGVTGLFEIRFVEVLYRTGAMVFGGGHVVLPLIEVGVVRPGWVDEDLFVAGYGLAQALPGPLFSFSSYLGASLGEGLSVLPRWLVGLIALISIYLPSWLLVIGLLPFWVRWGGIAWVRGVFTGINSAMIGLLIAAFFQPVCQQGLTSGAGIVIAAIGYLLLAVFRWPAWLVVLVSGIGGLLAVSHGG
jgi:chromate transporter